MEVEGIPEAQALAKELLTVERLIKERELLSIRSVDIDRLTGLL